MERYERMKFSATSPEIDFLDEVAASIKGKNGSPESKSSTAVPSISYR